MSRAIGFGTGRGNEGIVAERPLTEADLLNDIREIRKKYVIPQVFQPFPFNFTALQGQRIPQYSTKINAFVLTVNSGVVFVYVGEFAGQFGSTPTSPHFVVSAGVVPVTVQIALPLSEDYVFCIQEAAGATAEGTFIPMGL